MVSIGPTIGIKGESSYKLALRNIISETKNLNSEMDLMVAKFKEGDSAIEKNKKTQEQLSKQLDVTKQAYVGIQDMYERAKNKLEENRQKQLEAIKAYEEVANATEKDEKAIAEAEKALNKANDEVNKSERLVNEWGAKLNQAGIEVETLQRKLDEITPSLQNTGKAFITMGENMAKAGEDLAKYVTTPLTAIGTASVKMASDFEDGMAKVYTIATESQKPMNEMKQELIALSNETGFSLSDLTEATYQSVSASVDAAKATEFLADAANLARAGFTSTTRSVDLLTTVINAYGLKAEDAVYISDVLLKTQNDGKTVIDDLAQSMGVVIPTAANYNVSLEQLAAGYATMTKQGVNTAQATTFMNAMFTELEKSSSTVSKTLQEKTGKSFAQLMGEGMSLADVLEILYNSVGGNNEEFQRLFGNIRSGKAAAALTSNDFQILRQEIDNIAHASGQTSYALEQLETPSLQAKRALNQLKNTGVDIGTTLINEMYPSFTKVADGIKNLTQDFANLNEDSKKMIVQFGLLATATGPVLKVGGEGLALIGKIISGQASLAGATIPGLILAYGALGVAVQTSMQAHRDEIAAQWGLNEEMKAVIETSNEMAQAYADRKQAIMDDMNATMLQVETAETLVEKYNNLIDSTGEVRDGHQALADVYINELASALGMEIDQVKEMIDENGKFGDSILQNIEDMRKRAEAAAYQDILTESTRRQIQAQMELEEQEEQLVIAQAHVKETTVAAQQAYEDMIRAQKEGNPEVGAYEQAWRDAVEAESQARASEKELRAAIDETKNRVTAAEQDANRAAQKIEDIATGAMTDTAETIKTGGVKIVNEGKSIATKFEQGFTIDGDNVGYRVNQGLSNGISKYSYLVTNASASLANKASTALNGALRINSPSKVTTETGEFFGMGLVKGMESQLRQIETMASMLGDYALGGLNMELQPSSNTVNHTVTAPISLNVTVNGNVDDSETFTRSLAENLASMLMRESEVFA